MALPIIPPNKPILALTANVQNALNAQGIVGVQAIVATGDAAAATFVAQAQKTQATISNLQAQLVTLNAEIVTAQGPDYPSAVALLQNMSVLLGPKVVVPPVGGA